MSCPICFPGISEVVYLCDMKHDKPSTEAARVLFTQKGVAQFKPNLLSKTILLDFENMREVGRI